jgi:transposase
LPSDTVKSPAKGAVSLRDSFEDKKDGLGQIDSVRLFWYNGIVEVPLPMKQYNAYASAYQVILPLAVEILIPQDESVRTVGSVLAQIDFSDEARAYAKRRRKLPFIIMLRVVVYGFMRGFRSVRSIETACRENINFMWLLEGYPAPDHNTIARFITAVDMNEILVKLNKRLIREGEIKFENAFIDGTKLEANANRYSFVWKKSIEKHQTRLLPKIEAFMREFSACYGVNLLSIEGIINYLESREILFVYGKGKRKSQEQRDLETARELCGKLTKYDRYIETT